MCATAVGCGKPAISRCSRCLGEGYCSNECQTRAWPALEEPCNKAVVVMRASMGEDTIKGVDKKILKFKRAAEAENVVAQVNLGICYVEGTSVAGDKVESFKWYKRAAEQGETQAQSNLGFFYQNGNGGVIVDEHEAVKWYRRAAEQGFASGAVQAGHVLRERHWRQPLRARVDQMVNAVCRGRGRRRTEKS